VIGKTVSSISPTRRVRKLSVNAASWRENPIPVSRLYDLKASVVRPDTEPPLVAADEVGVPVRHTQIVHHLVPDRLPDPLWDGLSR